MTRRSTPTALPVRGMVGSHLSVAGGMERAIVDAAGLGLDCVQVFTKNQRQWAAPPLTEETVAAWRGARAEAGWDDLPGRAVSHNSYLCNLASPDEELRRKSIAQQRDELERCERLGIRFCVIHPGAHLGSPRKPGSPNALRQAPSADEVAGLARVASALDELHRSLKGYAVVTCLETTTGSGTNLGYDFAHLARIRSSVKAPDRIGFCLDTCHVASAGYDVASDAAASATLDEFDRVCGLERLFVLHMNDSKSPPGSRLDRHEHIGLGTCGLPWFGAIMNHPRLAEVPKILETEKQDDPTGRPWDLANAARLRSLLKGLGRMADKPSAEPGRPQAAGRRRRVDDA